MLNKPYDLMGKSNHCPSPLDKFQSWIWRHHRKILVLLSLLSIASLYLPTP